MYNALPCFVCARSIVFCQDFCQIMQWLPSYWTGEGDDFHGPLRQVLPLPFMCLPLSHPFFLEPKYFPALATQANTIRLCRSLTFMLSPCAAHKMD